MTSADLLISCFLLFVFVNSATLHFLVHRKRIYSKTSLGKANTLWLISAESTISIILLLQSWDVTMMCLLIRFYSLISSLFTNVIFFVFIFSLCSGLFVRTNHVVSLTSVHSSRKTTLRLTLLQGTTPAH